MTGATSSNDFFGEVFRSVFELPLKGIAVSFLVGILNAALNLTSQLLVSDQTSLKYSLFAILIVMPLSAIYLVSMLIIGVSSTWAGGIRFVLTMACIVGLPLALIFCNLPFARDQSVVATTVIVTGCFLALFVLPLLSGWPQIQSLSSRLISPIRILRATKGYRWGLITACYASTAVNKLLPNMNTVHSLGQRIFLEIGNGAVSAVSIVLLATISATAWKFAVRKDAGLDFHPSSGF